MKPATFRSAALVLALFGVIIGIAQAQSPYKAPDAYGGAVSSNSSSAISVMGGTVVAVPPPRPANGSSVAQPAGRPAPAAPMPSPLPLTFNPVQSAIDQSVPLNPEEITRLLRAIYERQMAGQENVTGRPAAKPVTSVETLDLSPGATPPIIRVALGQGAVISFSDSAGRPWPIADNLNFNDRAYSAKLIGPHLYSITLKSREAANLTVVLKDLARPIVITALPAGDETDYLKEFTVPRFLGGEPPPSAAAASRDGGLSFNSSELIAFLYRTPPKGAKNLNVTGLPGVMAWQTSASRMVVRTSGQVVIPAFVRRHAATDGVSVYEVPLSPVVSITDGGSLHRVSVSGYTVDPAAPSATGMSNASLAIPNTSR